MKKCFIFCHGFGYDKTFWNHLIPYFSTAYCINLELGYYRNYIDSYINYRELQSKAIQIVGIGHSLGLLKLLQLPIHFDYLIGLNSFTHFLGKNRTLQLIRKKELQTVMKHFILSPLITLKNFHKRCGVVFNNITLESFDKELLMNDLHFLFTQTTFIPYETQTLIIGSKNDPIVPPQLIYDNFIQYPNIKFELLDDGLHGLGFLLSNSIYEYITTFLQVEI